MKNKQITEMVKCTGKNTQEQSFSGTAKQTSKSWPMFYDVLCHKCYIAPVPFNDPSNCSLFTEMIKHTGIKQEMKTPFQELQKEPKELAHVHC